MKRSDMIYFIEEYLLHEFFGNVPKDLNGAWDSWKSAENILNVIENRGMIPPFNKNMIEEGDAVGMTGFQWEKE